MHGERARALAYVTPTQTDGLWNESILLGAVITVWRRHRALLSLV